MRRHEQIALESHEPLIQWRAVFGGVIIGLAAMVMMTSLWLAFAYGSGVDSIRANLDWYIGGSAIGVLFLSGLLAGWMSGVRGIASGVVNGATLWGLTLIAALAIGIPSTISAVGATEITTAPTDATWVGFWSILIAFGTAVIGGALGGLIPHPASTQMAMSRTERDDEIDLREDDHVHDQDDHVHDTGDRMRRDDDTEALTRARHRAEHDRAAM